MIKTMRFDNNDEEEMSLFTEMFNHFYIDCAMTVLSNPSEFVVFYREF